MNRPDNWFYVYILPLTPAALTIAVWAFLSWREKTKRISERKSKRIETAAALTEKITAAAVAYYLSQAAGSEAAAQEILFDLHRLGRLCGKRSQDLNSSLIRLRTAVSGGSFQSASRVPASPADPLVYAVKKAGADLIMALDDYHDE